MQCSKGKNQKKIQVKVIHVSDQEEEQRLDALADILVRAAIRRLRDKGNKSLTDTDKVV